MKNIIKVESLENIPLVRPLLAWASRRNMKWRKRPGNLKFRSTGNSTISLTNYGSNAPDMKYSLNGGAWTQWDYTAISLTNGDEVRFKGNNPNGFSTSSSKYSQFVMTGSLAASGNIMSLIDDGMCITLTIPCSHCYRSIFLNCSSLTSAPELPATTLTLSCYYLMFKSCSSLTSAPELPATTVALSCCYMMFTGCSSLTSAPSILPATTLVESCYSSMFMSCSSLTSAPELPATTLAKSCYKQMFDGCSSLTSAPELPATTLVNSCYTYMFLNCSNLNYIKCLATTNINTYYSTYNWVASVASSGTFVKAASATWPTGISGIPNNWTVLNA